MNKESETTVEITSSKIENILTEVICVSNINEIMKYHNCKAERFCSLRKSKNNI